VIGQMKRRLVIASLQHEVLALKSKLKAVESEVYVLNSNVKVLTARITRLERLETSVEVAIRKDI
jgi:uncharacterized protein involved in exopolysaccharide biosynthesis